METPIDFGSEAERIQNTEYWQRIREHIKNEAWNMLVSAAEKNIDPTPVAYMALGFNQIERLMKKDINAKNLALHMQEETTK